MEVGIVSYGHTKYGVLKEETPELMQTVIDQCMAGVENGIEPNEVDLVIASCVDNQFSNQHQTGTLAGRYLKNPNAEGFRVEAACSSGSMAVYIARRMILGGYAKNALVVGFEKMSRLSTETATSVLIRGGSPEEIKLGITQPACYALMAQLYMQKYGATEEDYALVSVKNHENAMRNPWAQLHKKITVEDVKNSRMIASPVRLFHCCPITDGAAAVLLSADPKNYTDTPVYIKEMGLAHDGMGVFEREDPTFIAASKKASDQVYKSANIGPKQLDLVEVHDAFTPAEIMVYEALGLAEKGKGYQLVRDGVVNFDGELPVNVSGGLKAKGHPVGATGIGMMVEMFLQLRGEAGERQVANVERTLCENHGGTGSVSVVTLLTR
jgi:acetyl-CoA C-acetyltransferase